MKTHKAVIISLSIICSFFSLSCSTSEPSLNKSPICEIIQPPNYALISLGNIVEIAVNASDPDGQIVHVKFFSVRFLSRISRFKYWSKTRYHSQAPSYDVVGTWLG